jgi:protein-S-isoprenylcysteine O-methyltransferase Ste14
MVNQEIVGLVEETLMTALKSLLFLIFVPGFLAVYIPLAFLREGMRIQTGIFAYLAFPLWSMGGVTLLWCFWDFLIKGKGTPAPIDPPKELVVTGLYRYVRNPMYVGVILTIIGHFLWFQTISIIPYVLFFFVATHLFIIGYEEPALKKTFGPAYEDYTNKVPRWVPRINK